MQTPEHYLALTFAYLPLSAVVAFVLCWLAQRIARRVNRRASWHRVVSGFSTQTRR